MASLCAWPTAAAANANPSAPVSFFLPITSSTDPKLTNELQSAFAAEGLNNVIVKNVDFWHPYQQGLREGRPGIYFAQPHFAAWAIGQHDFRPIYKLHGRLKYVLASRRNDSHLFEVNDIEGGVICREPGLNLGTVWLNSIIGKYRLTVSSKEVESAEHAMLNDSGDCDVFVIDDHAYDRVNNGQLGRYIRLKQSPVYKHNALVAHPNIPNALTDKLKTALKTREIKALLAPYLTGLSKWQNLLPVKQDDYSADDHELLNAYWEDE